MARSQQSALPGVRSAQPYLPIFAGPWVEARDGDVTGLGLYQRHYSRRMIRAADLLADERWPGERHYTYVNPLRIRSTNPGFCFQAAGWQRCGLTKKSRLVILERA
jgi:hypothetical protein